MTVACRAYGLRPIDGPFGDIKDPEGYKRQLKEPLLWVAKENGRYIPRKLRSLMTFSHPLPRKSKKRSVFWLP